MYDIAIRIDLRVMSTGRIDRPAQRPLHRIPTRRQSQILNTAFHGIAVPIQCFMADVEVHGVMEMKVMKVMKVMR
jgi:hypothetical protein